MTRPKSSIPAPTIPLREARIRLRPGTMYKARVAAARNAQNLSEWLQEAIDEQVGRQGRPTVRKGA